MPTMCWLPRLPAAQRSCGSKCVRGPHDSHGVLPWSSEFAPTKRTLKTMHHHARLLLLRGVLLMDRILIDL